jgi:hypothetical protein
MKQKSVKLKKRIGLLLALSGLLILAGSVSLIWQFAKKYSFKQLSELNVTSADNSFIYKPSAQSSEQKAKAAGHLAKENSADKSEILSHEKTDVDSGKNGHEKKQTNMPEIPPDKKWRLVMDEKTYKPEDGALKAIDEMAMVLKSDKKTRLRLTGINNIKKSQKRARHAARVILDMIRRKVPAAGYRIDIDVIQNADAKGLIVTAVQKGGMR